MYQSNRLAFERQKGRERPVFSRSRTPSPFNVSSVQANGASSVRTPQAKRRNFAIPKGKDLPTRRVNLIPGQTVKSRITDSNDTDSWEAVHLPPHEAKFSRPHSSRAIKNAPARSHRRNLTSVFGSARPQV